MKTVMTILTFLMLLSAAGPVRADGTPANGTIIEQSAFSYPTYDRLPAWMKALYTNDAYEGFRNSATVELIKIKYMSNGLKIVGFICKPRASGKYPVIIYNRGGVGELAKIGEFNFNYIYEMHRYAQAGFVVLASQYRGVDGSEGKDEIGGADLNDVKNLLPLAKTLPYADTNNLFIWGYSRGALMAMQAVRDGLPVKAVVVVGAPTDYFALLDRSPQLLNNLRAVIPDFDQKKQEELTNRSPILWIDKVDVPVLILQGGADAAVPAAEALSLARKFQEMGKLYELIIYAKDDHQISLNREDRIRRTIEWYKSPKTMPIGAIVERAVREKGIKAAIALYHDLRKNRADKYDFGEPELNRIGYQLLFSGQAKDAIEIFRLNVEAYPEAFNTYDSLAEAYLAIGEKELAIKNYRRSLELNPANTNAEEKLKELGVQGR